VAPSPGRSGELLATAQGVTRTPTLVVVALCVLAPSCGSSRASIGLAVDPDPAPVDLAHPCAGVFAMFPCSATEYLYSRWTVSVSARNDIGGRGSINVRVVDAASGQPLPEPQDIVLGGREVLLAPGASVSWPIEWRRPIPPAGAGRIVPPQLAFVISVEVTDTTGHRVSDAVTVREKLPRAWQIF
jgi:hypothetical protein